MNFKNSKFRFMFIVVTLSLIFLSFVFSLIQIQIGQGDYYQALSQKRIYSTEVIRAARGNIYDCNGNLLVTNKMGYAIKYSKAQLPADKQNEIILTVCNIMKKNNAEYIDTLPIELKSEVRYKSDADKKDIKNLLSEHKLKKNATAKELFEKLKKDYKIDEKYSDKEAIIIAGVRYEMKIHEFSISTPFTFASNVSINIVSEIKELSSDLPGVNIETEYVRHIVDGTVAPHILGTVGKIYKEEYEELKSKGYSMDAIIGKDGIEKVMEDELRGKDGIRVIEKSSDGTVLNVEVTKEPVSGKNVILTIDKNYQVVAQNSLKKTIQSIASRGKAEGQDACAGAVVALDVNSGAVLAMASYPTYDLNEYYKNYTALSKDDLKPLYNRAVYGTYAPGSTFKMATGIAGLEENVISPYTTIVDKGIYTKYPDYTPRCWVYSDYGSTHGAINVSGALKVSCNYFFYEVADRLGISNLNSYCKKLGLGIKTGIEIGESSGVLAGPEYRKKIDEQWFPGDTLQAAIGQSDNLFTPLQLASYVSTVVNGGTRYKTHLVKDTKTAENGVSTKTTDIEILNKLNMKSENYHAIMQGMLQAAKSGTASNLFSNYAIDVGAKTGTASVPKGTANGIFVCFAPYENPEIAVAVIVEHGAHGNYVGQVAKDIYDEYLKKVIVEQPQTGENTLLP